MTHPRSRPLVRHRSDVESTDVRAGAATRTQVLLGEADGAPHFAMRRFVMGQGGGMPLHTNEVEHEQYVLGGRARVRLGDDVHTVEAGTVLLIPAGLPHSYEVVEEPFEFLCLVPHGPDRIRLVDEPETLEGREGGGV